MSDVRTDMADDNDDALQALNARLEKLEALVESNPREVGREVAKAINKAAASGQRRRGPVDTLADDSARSFEMLYELRKAKIRRHDEIVAVEERYQSEVRRIVGE